MHGRGGGDVHGRGGGDVHGRGACVAGGHAWHARPPHRYYGIQSMSGRYASCWNAFLFVKISRAQNSLYWRRRDVHSPMHFSEQRHTNSQN